jgi:hypothetical protein
VAPIAAQTAYSASWTLTGLEPSSRWLASLPFPVVASLGLDRFCLTVGVSVVLLATANGLVRAVLTAAGTPIGHSQQRLRGGRLIGPLERLMIFGLAVAGEPTAAALIVSAKSLLRFPELSKTSPATGSRPDADPIGERASGDTAGDSAPGQFPNGDPRPDEDPPPITLEIDYVTEYFLLGSLTSWILALAPAILLQGP